MSNCVDIYSTVFIPFDQINVPALMQDIEEVNKLPKAPSWEDGHRNVIWWFLGKENVWTEDNLLCINLGDHRSMHTWRDLAGTLKALNKYALQEPIIVPIELMDTDSGQNLRGICYFRITDGKIIKEEDV